MTPACSLCLFPLPALDAGYHLGVLNTCQSHVEADLNTSHEGGGAAMVAGLLVGATLGSLLSGRLADRFGPR